MRYLFQNRLNFQAHAQLVVSDSHEKPAYTFEIRSDTNPGDSRTYQLNGKELLELRDLLTQLIGAGSTISISPTDIQQADVVE
ncbi:hypothetical protein DYBT9623_04463 [Dyadobacter sp. CECT 9623]|uniref:Uncharacterized protein n=1 Tax=Dyadobacter linearis TaxID=2823330 RepID=A0ABN7RGU7_9BACT|nr:hypothetical protein [Dyadobacter sp. CECT 9623]CAG5072926.1 hypothetical protein DYBT9623_04463 [Dyadobacter sp. CECT 9623]